MRYLATEMLTVILLTCVMTISGQKHYQPQKWVTKILAETLDDYTPDGGIVCRRHGLEYREGLKELKLWATQSKLNRDLFDIFE